MSSVLSYAYQASLMGSDIILKFYERQDSIAKQALLRIQNWEQRLTVNAVSPSAKYVSEIAAVNAAAGQSAVRVSNDIFALLQLARQVSLYQDSCFNFAVGPIIKAWNIGFAAARIPHSKEIASLLPLTNPHSVILNAEDSSVFLPKKAMRLDLGAIAKGFIADDIKYFLQKNGIKTALINLGGNIHSLGSPVGGGNLCARESGLIFTNKAGIYDSGGEDRYWAVGLQKPFAGKRDLLGVIYSAGKSVVTSGIYERYFLTDNSGQYIRAGDDAVSAERARQAALRAIFSGKSSGDYSDRCGDNKKSGGYAHQSESYNGGDIFYHHIFDRKTGFPLHNDLMSVTVISENSVDGEIWTSIFYGLGLEKAAALLRAAAAFAPAAAPSVLHLPPLPAMTVIFVTKDRRIICGGIGDGIDCRFMPTDKSYQVTKIR